MNVDDTMNDTEERLTPSEEKLLMAAMWVIAFWRAACQWLASPSPQLTRAGRYMVLVLAAAFMTVIYLMIAFGCKIGGVLSGACSFASAAPADLLLSIIV